MQELEKAFAVYSWIPVLYILAAAIIIIGSVFIFRLIHKLFEYLFH